MEDGNDVWGNGWGWGDGWTRLMLESDRMAGIRTGVCRDEGEKFGVCAET